MLFASIRRASRRCQTEGLRWLAFRQGRTPAEDRLAAVALDTAGRVAVDMESAVDTAVAADTGKAVGEDMLVEADTAAGAGIVPAAAAGRAVVDIPAVGVLHLVHSEDMPSTHSGRCTIFH